MIPAQNLVFILILPTLVLFSLYEAIPPPNQFVAEPIPFADNNALPNPELVMENGRPRFQSLETLKEIRKMTEQYQNEVELLKDRGPRETLGHERYKRTVLNITSQQWTKGIVPYKFHPSLTTSLRQAAEWTMKLWSYWTNYRFYPWNSTIHSNFGLGHNTTLYFVSGTGCSSYVGRVISGDQTVYCCGMVACTHELGHVLGLHHEQNHYERDRVLRVNYNEIQPAYINNFGKVSPSKYANFGFYDFTSTMHYGLTIFTLRGQHVMLFLDPDLEYLLSIRADDDTGLFYPAFEVQRTLNLEGTTCSGFTTVCRNEGYLSVVDGECTCRCPYGLNPTDGCQSIAQTDATLQSMSWPNEPFALLKPLSGCPLGFYSDGSVKRYKDYAGYGFLNSTTSPFHAAGEFVTGYVREEFCVRDTSVPGNPSNQAKWNQDSVSFCIHKAGGVCPTGFDGGYIQYDDYELAGATNSSGHLPDGVFFGSNATKMEFCCKSGSSSYRSLRLPTAQPFIIYPKDSKDCPKVEGMLRSSESYYFFNTKNSNLDTTSGATPYIRQIYSNVESYKEINICYYYPYTQDCGGMFEVIEGTPLTISTPNYPNNYSNAMQCIWFIKGPKNGKLRLKFETFNFTKKADGTCEDIVEIRHTFPGHRGMRVCGNGYLKTIMTESNHLILMLTTSAENGNKGFLATVDAITEAQLSYVNEGINGIYSGTVNITKNFDVCIPWEDVFANCSNHPFQAEDYDDDLESNYCRNPGAGNRPWCYTNVDGCIRDYCDVTYNELCYDFYGDCQEVIVEDSKFCTSKFASKCAASCGICSRRIQPSLSPTITCSPPEVLPDGSYQPVKSLYSIGESVVYTCQDGLNTKQRYCSSEGTWVPNLNFVCEERVVCEDQEENCDAIIERNPDVCINYPDYAWKKCPRSCGRCTDADPTGKSGCAVPVPSTEASTMMSLPTSLAANTITTTTTTTTTTPAPTQDNTTTLSTTTGYASGGGRRKKRSRKDIRRKRRQIQSIACSCSSPGTPQYATMIRGNVTIKVGDYFQYDCNAGFVHNSGNLKRACLPTGQLTGSVPVCVDETQVTTPINSVSIRSRDNIDPRRYAMLGNNPYFRIKKAGEIRAWNFYSYVSGELGLQVWRPNGGSYTLVGQNYVSNARDDRERYIEVTAGSRIQVQVNDLIGFTYYGASTNGGIPYDWCTSSLMPDAVNIFKSVTMFSPTSQPLNGISYNFSTITVNPCRLYSLNAMVGPRT
ncbi:hypothetical protein CHS0354_036184 [Potamilus streckersoni]|uniref:Metalloendopeptidase n=1 Tax=Potamilus streckersoni TaxID=2493646 RepID=A0AAE0SVH8_9BIVA|nr:hypothetical protein CHS0354_036184 [Potamilus streckersoni]